MTNPYKNECKHLVDHDCFLDRAEVAAHYRRAEKTLANWASAGYGPPFELMRGRPLYHLCCLRTWEEQQRRNAEEAS